MELCKRTGGNKNIEILSYPHLFARKTAEKTRIFLFGNIFTNQ